MEFKDLTEEQRAKARKCSSVDELLELADKEGIELTDEQLDGVAGGNSWGGSDDGHRIM